MIHDGEIARLVTIRIFLFKKPRKQTQSLLMLYEKNIAYMLLKHEETQNLFVYAS